MPEQDDVTRSFHGLGRSRTPDAAHQIRRIVGAALVREAEEQFATGRSLHKGRWRGRRDHRRAILRSILSGILGGVEWAVFWILVAGVGAGLVILPTLIA